MDFWNSVYDAIETWLFFTVSHKMLKGFKKLLEFGAKAL